MTSLLQTLLQTLVTRYNSPHLVLMVHRSSQFSWELEDHELPTEHREVEERTLANTYHTQSIQGCMWYLWVWCVVYRVPLGIVGWWYLFHVFSVDWLVGWASCWQLARDFIIIIIIVIIKRSFVFGQLHFASRLPFFLFYSFLSDWIFVNKKPTRKVKQSIANHHHE